MLNFKEENENKYSFYERIISKQDQEFLQSKKKSCVVEETSEIR